MGVSLNVCEICYQSAIEYDMWQCLKCDAQLICEDCAGKCVDCTKCSEYNICEYCI